MKLIIFKLSLNMSIIRTLQITCQMIFSKDYFSLILIVFFLVIFSCKNTKYEDSNYTSKIEVIRFEKIFFESNIDSILSLKSKFPYLFPNSFQPTIG